MAEIVLVVFGQGLWAVAESFRVLATGLQLLALFSELVADFLFQGQVFTSNVINFDFQVFILRVLLSLHEEHWVLVRFEGVQVEIVKFVKFGAVVVRDPVVAADIYFRDA